MSGYRLLSAACLASLLSACLQTPEQRPTLRSIDVVGGDIDTVEERLAPKSEAEIRRAYADYIREAGLADRDRAAAITRLAQIEFDIGERLRLQQQQAREEAAQAAREDRQYLAQLERTITLLTTALRDYPEADNNDSLLYQLAKAYDQKGDYDASITTLQRLIDDYPASPHYVEAQFRLGEAAFVTGDYITAEDAYTEVIVAPDNQVFYEKAIFKRGWARLKQQIYDLAVDDFVEAVTYHRFGEMQQLSESERDQFDEYFRSIGLAFSYLGGAHQLHTYFDGSRDFQYIYYTYATISDIYLQQERFYDAADTLALFRKHYPDAREIPLSDRKVIEVWRESGFTDKLHEAIEDFYVRYHADSDYWRQSELPPAVQQQLGEDLKDYVLLSSAYFHNRYQRTGAEADFTRADKWYRRYLDNYPSSARQDNIHFLYAELLDQAGQPLYALPYYELAAYDGDVILNKAAAYATIGITDKQLADASAGDAAHWLNKHLRYARLYAQLYPNDPQTDTIRLHAANLAFDHRRYPDVIALIDRAGSAPTPRFQIEAGQLRAQAYFHQQRYAEAEESYLRLLNAEELDSARRREIVDGLALSIYRQAEQAKAAGDTLRAYDHYTRISRAAGRSDIAATGLYDAAAIAIQGEHWPRAIDAIEYFQQRYPDHEYNPELTKKLSVAYLNADQLAKAATELEKVSAFEEDASLKKAALWQAAQLHLTKANTADAIRLFRDYAHTYKTPFPQYIESMQQLIELYGQTNEPAKANFWRRKIIAANNKAYPRQKTERTEFIAATATLELARQLHQDFTYIQLRAPLQSQLKKKKSTMQQAVRFYGQASSFGLHENTTEATFSIGRIYEQFSVALLDSERPGELQGEELIQYEILLEDQAFPFEAKAIEFYETNVGRLPQGGYNEWIEKSLERLNSLFPARYQRQEKLPPYFDIR